MSTHKSAVDNGHNVILTKCMQNKHRPSPWSTCLNVLTIMFPKGAKCKNWPPVQIKRWQHVNKVTAHWCSYCWLVSPVSHAAGIPLGKCCRCLHHYNRSFGPPGGGLDNKCGTEVIYSGANCQRHGRFRWGRERRNTGESQYQHLEGCQTFLYKVVEQAWAVLLVC